MGHELTIAHITDDVEILERYKQELEPHGVKVEEFENANAGLEAITHRHYDLILMDIGTIPSPQNVDPKIHEIMQRSEFGVIPYWRIGHYLIERAKADDSPNKETPIVVLTHHDPDFSPTCASARERALRRGADKYFHSGQYHKDVAAEIMQLLAPQG